MDGFDVLEIGTPSFIGFVVGMTDIMPDLVAFTANTAYLGHGCSFQYEARGNGRGAYRFKY
jgi:hypothetical protein